MAGGRASARAVLDNAASPALRRALRWSLTPCTLLLLVCVVRGGGILGRWDGRSIRFRFPFPAPQEELAHEYAAFRSLPVASTSGQGGGEQHQQGGGALASVAEARSRPHLLPGCAPVGGRTRG